VSSGTDQSLSNYPPSVTTEAAEPRRVPNGSVAKRWPIHRLGDVATIHDNQRVPISEPDRQRRRGEYPYCGANGILDSIDDYRYDGEYVLLAEDGGYWGAYEASAYLMKGRFWVNNHAHVLRGKPGVLDNVFLTHVLNYLDLTPFISGTTRGKLNQGVMVDIALPMPPITEQRAIAHVLQTVQKPKEARQRELILERERKAALMEHLFTHGTRGEKTKETEVGNIPESWNVLPMATVAKIERGKFAHRPRNDPAYYGGTTPFVQTGDVTASDGHITKYSQTLNERGLSVSKIFPRGTILITIAANIGFSAILEFDSAFPDSLIGITPTECIDAEFLNYYLMTQQPEMDRKAPRGTQKNINIEFLAPWQVPVPPLDEQLRIASALRASDCKSKGLRQETALLTELFDVMLKDLMTGRISASALVEKAQ